MDAKEVKYMEKKGLIIDLTTTYIVGLYFLLRNFELNIDEILSVLESNKFIDIGIFFRSYMNLGCLDDLHNLIDYLIKS